MSTRSLGTLTLDLVAKIGGFERGMDAAERKSKRTADQIARDQQKRAKEMAAAWATAGTAVGAGLTAATAALSVWIKGSIDAIDQFNDLKDVTGSSIENISALDAVARQTGASFEQVASTLTKFNGVLKDADPTKGPGAVLRALNLDIEELKKLDPAEALRRTAVALQGFADDGSKARAVQELFGKSVKDTAPFLKDLAEAGELQAKVSTQAAEEIDRFNKEMARAKANADDLARALSIDLVTGINEVSDAFTKGRAAGKGFFEIASDRYWKNIKDFYRDIGLLEKEVGKFQPTTSVDDQSSAELAKLLRQSKLPSLNVPADAKAPKKSGTDNSAKEAQSYLENLQKQLQATQDLSVAETVLADLRSGRLKLAGGVTEAELVGVAKQIDAARALTKSLDEQKQAMAAIEQMEAAIDSKALADVEALIQGNQALRDEIELLGLEGSERAKVEQARLDSTIALKEEEIQMAKTNGASATQISALEREINLLQQRSKLLAQKGARMDEVKAIDEMMKRQEQAYKNIQDALGQGLADIANGNFDNIGRSFTQMLNRMAAEAVAADLMNALFGKADSKGQRGDGVFSGIFSSVMGAIFGGAPGKASGGPVMAGGLYEVNENGPEMLAMNGRQYLMMGNQSGTVIPNRGKGGNSVVNNFTIQGPVDRRTESQIAAAVARSLRSADRNL